MDNPGSLSIQVGSPTYSTHLLLIGIILLALALIVEFLRRKRTRWVQTRSEWAMVEKIAKGQGLAQAEWTFLRDFISRRSPRAPLSVVTIRAKFEQCVEAEMNALLTRDNKEHFREVGILLRGIREALGFDVPPLGHRMQTTREMRAQQIVWIAPSGTADPPPRWSKAIVVGVDEACFHMSISDGSLPPLKLGETAKCWLWREDDARYAFGAIPASTDGSPPVYSFMHTKNLQRMQSRAYYRVHVNQETTLGILAPPDDTDDGTGERRIVTRMRARLSSLSGGGCAAIAQQAPSQNALLRIPITVPGDETLQTDARVIAVETLPGGRFLVRMEFVDIHDEYRDAVARYILRCQLPLASLKETPAEAVE